ncbi:MAG: hypothetical protein PVI27_00685 [Desulfobacteraceae bacterium]|jgi:hypothetical protein
MAEIVDLAGYRSRLLARKAFGAWSRRFGEVFGETTRPKDLSDKCLYALALPGEQGNAAYYELIMGVLELGAASLFPYLEAGDKMRVVDIHLFLADQVRFELMRRLGWLSAYPTQRFGLIEMVREFGRVQATVGGQAPQLADSHPEYGHYQRLHQREKETFVRRKLPDALATFQKHLL